MHNSYDTKSYVAGLLGGNQSVTTKGFCVYVLSSSVTPLDTRSPILLRKFDFHKTHENSKRILGITATRTKNMPKFMLLPLLILCLALLFSHTHFALGSENAVFGLNPVGSKEIDANLSRSCSKKIGECIEDAEMESEISRRVLLVQKKYISYETLKRDKVPCETPGASYYECTATNAHPYGRGCEVITRCARNVN